MPTWLVATLVSHIRDKTIISPLVAQQLGGGRSMSEPNIPHLLVTREQKPTSQPSDCNPSAAIDLVAPRLGGIFLTPAPYGLHSK